MDGRPYRRNSTLSKDFACLTSHPVRGWTGKNKAFCSPGTQNGRRVIKVYKDVFSNFPVVMNTVPQKQATVDDNPAGIC